MYTYIYTYVFYVKRHLLKDTVLGANVKGRPHYWDFRFFCPLVGQYHVILLYISR